MVVLVVVVLLLNSIKSGPSKAVVAYCERVGVGTATVRSTEAVLGKPSSQGKTSVLGVPEIRLSYGSATFLYTFDAGAWKLVAFNGC